ncbi:MAG TPA: cyclopropane fatty acyl phospholipid synthase [Fibrobacteria bacterium]|nr:cyclopropane fatty acyl phospholipid synthase [Fibrobacteria bacterium]
MKTKAKSRAQGEIEDLLEHTNVRIGGDRPWDLRIHDERFYDRVLVHGTLGLGEAYMQGWWDCESLDEFFCQVLRGGLQEKVERKPMLILSALEARLRNRQAKFEPMGTVRAHYDLGNDLYQAMLDKNMVYTCAYWKNAHNLEQAQSDKLDLVCRKLNLEKGMRMLDVGCGWGSLCKFAAERYGVETVGITIAGEQAKLARELCKGLPVEIRVQDYREVDEEFDRVVSLGMFEHVGVKHFRPYMNVAHRCLKDGGLFLLHTMGGNKSYTETNDWIDKYIFPDSIIPSIAQIGGALEDLFVMEDWHNMSTDYDRTLLSWHANFQAAWPRLEPRYGRTFKRMWEYYLLSFAGLFRARQNQVWQIVLSKNSKFQYQSVR